MVIRIPIEIETSEATEIRELLDKIERASEKLTGIQTAAPARPGTIEEEITGREQASTGIVPQNRQFRAPTGQPITNAEKAATTPLGTPFGEVQEPVLPKTGRAGGGLPGGGAPEDLVRQNQFKALQEQQTNVEQQLNKVLGLGGQAVGTGLLFAKGGGLAGAKKLLTAVAPIAGPIGAVFLAKSIFDAVIDELIRDGGILDRRFKRDLNTEFGIFRTREDKGLIRAGLKEIRISTGPIGKKAIEGSVGSTFTAAKAGNRAQGNQDLEFGAIGVP